LGQRAEILRALDPVLAAWLYERPSAPCKDAAVPIRHRFPIALALIACCAAQAPAAMAQTAPGPATKPPAAPDPAVLRPMVFYDAHGEANACGPGCSEWIAAEGKIDRGAADRLQHLLARLRGARRPIFFHSPGGLVIGSILLGETIRARKLTVSVGHTVPLNCERDPKSQNSCDADIRAGRPIEAKLDLLTAMCNSACVYALASGVVRLIPPWVTLGIHDVGFDPAAAKIRHPSARVFAAAKAVIDRRLHNYIRHMGIDEGLLTEASATPFTSMGRLTRDDAARFGFDRREFGETVWRFVDKPQPTIRKLFFVRAANGERRYVNALVSASCVPRLRGTAIVVLARQRLDSDTETVVGPPAVSIRINDRDIRLARVTSDKIYLWGGRLALTTLAAASDETVMSVPGEELGRQQSPAGDITLAMTGFSAAYAKLQKVCAPEAVQATGMPPLPSRLQSAPDAIAMPPLSAKPPAIGASRLAVDAAFGAPTKTVGTTALYGYSASDGEHKILAAFFDRSDHLQRFARYILQNGKVFDEISQTELSEGPELNPVRHLLADPNIGAAPPSKSQDSTGTSTISVPDRHRP
jgi:hypothetical protein